MNLFFQVPEADLQAGLAHLGGDSPVPVVGHDGIGQANYILAVDLVGLL